MSSEENIAAEIGRFEDGKIVERWGSNDELGILKQLGATPDEG